MPSTATLKPVKGMKFLSATKKKRYYFGEGEAPPLEMRVTSVQKGKVYLRGSDYEKYSVPVESFASEVGEVVSYPEPPVKMSSAEFEVLFKKAREAGYAAGEAAKPVPMVVGTPTDMFAANSPLDRTKPVYYVSEGVCGFAWVTTPGNTPFARWAKSKGIFSKAYGGGLQYWVSYGGQSMERKEAFANAFAAVLREAGITAYASSRMD